MIVALEGITSGDLDDAWRTCAGDLSKLRVGPRRVRVPKVRAVEQVEELAANLQ